MLVRKHRRRLWFPALASLVVLAAAGCGNGGTHGATPVTLRFWAFGREGEVVQALIPGFERAHPGIRVRVQQIPFTAAHEKLLTSVVGRATPDIAQLGNTWVPELVALRALVPLDSMLARSRAITRDDYFEGIWATNVLDGTTWGIPWYVDTRVIFYRSDLLKSAGFPAPPRTWSQWRDAMIRVRAQSGGHHYGILLPVNEWAQPVILGLSMGAPLLRDADTYGDFSDPRFQAAFAFYVGLFRDSLAEPVSNVQVANLYQSFGEAEFAMFISGPWDVGECLRRLPPSLQGRWATAPMPAPDAEAAADTTAPGLAVPRLGLGVHRVSLGPRAGGAILRAERRLAAAAFRMERFGPRPQHLRPGVPAATAVRAGDTEDPGVGRDHHTPRGPIGSGRAWRRRAGLRARGAGPGSGWRAREAPMVAGPGSRRGGSAVTDGR